jgi:hypothetical protein
MVQPQYRVLACRKIPYLVNLITHNPVNTQLNPICHLLALLGAHPILHVSRVWANARNFSVSQFSVTVAEGKPII